MKKNQGRKKSRSDFVDAVTKHKKIDTIQSGGKKGSVGFQKISSVIITKKDEKNKTKGGKSASIHFFIFLGIFSSVSVCEIASRSDQLAPVMYGQYRLLNKRSNPIRSKNYAKKQENHKITNSTTLNQNHPRKQKKKTAPLLTSEASTRCPEVVAAWRAPHRAPQGGCCRRGTNGRGCLHCAGEDNDVAEERAPPAGGRASPAEGGRCSLPWAVAKEEGGREGGVPPVGGGGGGAAEREGVAGCGDAQRWRGDTGERGEKTESREEEEK